MYLALVARTAINCKRSSCLTSVSVGACALGSPTGRRPDTTTPCSSAPRPTACGLAFRPLLLGSAPSGLDSRPCHQSSCRHPSAIALARELSAGGWSPGRYRHHLLIE